MIAAVHTAEMAKTRRLATRQEALRKEYSMREGCDAAQQELDSVEEQVCQAAEQRDREMRSLSGVLSDLEHKSSIATSEISKWTDNTLQVVQYITNGYSSSGGRAADEEELNNRVQMEELVQ